MQGLETAAETSFTPADCGVVVSVEAATASVQLLSVSALVWGRPLSAASTDETLLWCSLSTSVWRSCLTYGRVVSWHSRFSSAISSATCQQQTAYINISSIHTIEISRVVSFAVYLKEWVKINFNKINQSIYSFISDTSPYMRWTEQEKQIQRAQYT